MDSASLLLHGNGVVRLNNGRRFAFLHYVYRQISLLHVLPRIVLFFKIDTRDPMYTRVAIGKRRRWTFRRQNLVIETSVATFVDVTDDAARVWLSSLLKWYKESRPTEKV